MLSAIYEGRAGGHRQRAPKVEARWFTKVLIMNPSSAAMIRTVFLNKQALEKGASRPAGVGDMTGQASWACLGAGYDGRGHRAMSRPTVGHRGRADRPRSGERGQRPSRPSPAFWTARRQAGPAGPKSRQGRGAGARHRHRRLCRSSQGCDLLVEAVFEDTSAEGQGHGDGGGPDLPKDAIFASNTSTLPISELAKASGTAGTASSASTFSRPSTA